MKNYVNLTLSLFILLCIIGCSGIKSIPIESDCNQVEIVFRESPKKLGHGERYTFTINSKIENEIFISLSGVDANLKKFNDNTYLLQTLKKGNLILSFSYKSEQTNEKEFLCSQKFKIY